MCPTLPLASTAALSARGHANLEAFTRLYGVVRFFHPAESVRTADWNALAVRGAAAVESCASPDDLARALREVFGDVAPTLMVQTSARSPRIMHAPLADTAKRTAVTYWRHRGLSQSGRSSSGPFRSELVVVPLERGALPAGAPDPLRPVRLELGRGVVATVPVAVFRSFPETVVRLERPYEPPSGATLAVGSSARAVRVGVVIAAWSSLRYFFAYAEVTRPEWLDELHRALRAAAIAPDTVTMTRIVRRLAAALHDGHAFGFLQPAPNVGRPRAPTILLDDVEGQVVVTALGDDERGAGLRRGDIVDAVDGKTIDAVVRDAVALESGARVEYARLRALRFLLLGPAGSTVVIRVRTPGAPRSRNVSIVRRAAVPRTSDNPPSRYTAVEEVRPSVFYVDATRLTDSTFAAAVPRLAAATGVIFDLRGYPPFDTEAIIAHLIRAPVSTPSFAVPALSQPADAGRRFETSVRTIQPALPRIAGRVVILTGTGSISAVETTVAVLADHHLATIVGATTAGTNGNINVITLPAGYGLQFSGLRVIRRDGRLIQRNGITPDIPVAATLRSVERGEDRVLARAVELLGNTPAPRDRAKAVRPATRYR